MLQNHPAPISVKNKKTRLGIFGGTFDPIHLGHLLVAEDALIKLHLERVIFVPTYHPPHRPLPHARFEHRVRMAEIAVRNDPRFSVSRIEEGVPGPSYTTETLRRLRREYANARLYLLLGNDQYRSISRWHKPLELPRLAKLVVMSRPGIPRPPLFPGHNPRRIIFLNVIPVRLTASAIRERLASGKPICYSVPAAVAEYIYKNRLYLKKHQTKEDR